MAEVQTVEGVNDVMSDDGGKEILLSARVGGDGDTLHLLDVF